jgi:hypothetical protein
VLPESTPQTQVKDGRAWRIGTENEVAWINQEVTGGLSITASIPPMFAAYATLTFPLDPDAGRDVIRPAEDRFDDALLRVVALIQSPSRGGSGSSIPAQRMSSLMMLRACTCTPTGVMSSSRPDRMRGPGGARADGSRPYLS